LLEIHVGEREPSFKRKDRQRHSVPLWAGAISREVDLTTEDTEHTEDIKSISVHSVISVVKLLPAIDA
jgi:hypothetical protein